MVPGQIATRRALITLAFALIAASAMLYYHLGLFLPRVMEIRKSEGLGYGYAFGADFYPLWLTTHRALREHSDPYSAETADAIQIGIFGRTPDDRNDDRDDDRSIVGRPPDRRFYVNPAYANLLFWPIGFADFSVLRIALIIVLPLLTLVSLWLWMLALEWRPGALWFAVIALLALCNYPVLEALFAEQPGVIVGFVLSASALAIRRRKLLLAGILLAFSTIKPQMTLLVIVYLLLWCLHDWPRRSRLAVGFFSTMLVLISAPLLMWPHWIGQWLKVVLAYHHYSPPSLVSELLGPSLGQYLGPMLTLILLAAAAMLAWRNRGAEPNTFEFWVILSTLLALTSITLLPGQAVYDHVILFPGIFLLIHRWQDICSTGRTARLLQRIGIAVLLWPWIAAAGLIVARHWLSPERFYSPAMFALPIRTAGSFPFAVLALLALAIRQVDDERVNASATS